MNIFDFLKNENFLSSFLGNAVGGVIGATIATIITIILTFVINRKEAINGLYIDFEQCELVNKSNYSLKDLIIVPQNLINQDILQWTIRIDKIAANSSLLLNINRVPSSYIIRKTYFPKMLRNKTIYWKYDSNLGIPLRYKINSFNQFYIEILERVKYHFKILLHLFALFKEFKNKENMRKYNIFYLTRLENSSIGVSLYSNSEDPNSKICEYEEVFRFYETLFSIKDFKSTENCVYFANILFQFFVFVFNRTPINYRIFKSSDSDKEYMNANLSSTKLNISKIEIIKIYFCVLFNKLPTKERDFDYYKEYFNNYVNIGKIDKIFIFQDDEMMNKLSHLSLFSNYYSRELKINKINIFNLRNNKIKIYYINNNKFLFFGSKKAMQALSLNNKSKKEFFPSFLKIRKKRESFILLNFKTFEFLHISENDTTVGTLDKQDFETLKQIFKTLKSKRRTKRRFKKYINPSLDPSEYRNYSL